jgi:hypothetical protein
VASDARLAVALLNRDLIRDLRRGLSRGLVLAALPLWILLASEADTRALWMSLSLLSLVGAAIVVTGLEGAARRRPENSRFWQYLGILVVSGLTPFAIFLQGVYLEGVADGDAAGALAELIRRNADPMFLVVILVCVVFWGAIPTLVCSGRIRDEPAPTAFALKRGALISLPLILAPVTYIAALLTIGALSLVLTLADWIEAFLFRPPKGEDREILVGRLARGEISRRDLHLAVILGHTAAISISGQAREQGRLEDMLAELQYGGSATLARAAHALAALAAPSAAEPESARRALDLAGQAIRSNKGALVEEELARWPWRRDAPASQRAIHSVLEAARSLDSGWGSTTCQRSVKECAEIALEVSTREGARAAVVAALLPWVLGEYDPLPQAPSSPAMTEDEGKGPEPAEPEPAEPEPAEPEPAEPEPAEPEPAEPIDSAAASDAEDPDANE